MEDYCPLTMNLLKDIPPQDRVTLQCRHEFHALALQEYLQSVTVIPFKCPLCRQPIQDLDKLPFKLNMAKIRQQTQQADHGDAGDAYYDTKDDIEEFKLVEEEEDEPVVGEDLMEEEDIHHETDDEMVDDTDTSPHSIARLLQQRDDDYVPSEGDDSDIEEDDDIDDDEN